MFRRHGKQPWKPNWVTKRFLSLLRSNGIPDFRLHDLRHFMATQMLGANVPISVVSAGLARVRLSTTLNVYAHAIPSSDFVAAEIMVQMVVGAAKKSSLPFEQENGLVPMGETIDGIVLQSESM